MSCRGGEAVIRSSESSSNAVSYTYWSRKVELEMPPDAANELTEKMEITRSNQYLRRQDVSGDLQFFTDQDSSLASILRIVNAHMNSEFT